MAQIRDIGKRTALYERLSKDDLLRTREIVIT
jgi:hypothetical protein